MLYYLCLECLYVRLYLCEGYMSHMAGALHLAPAEQPLSHTPALISISKRPPTHPLASLANIGIIHNITITYSHRKCFAIYICRCALIHLLHLSVAINILNLSWALSDHRRLVITNHYRLISCL